MKRNLLPLLRQTDRVAWMITAVLLLAGWVTVVYFRPAHDTDLLNLMARVPQDAAAEIDAHIQRVRLSDFLQGVLLSALALGLTLLYTLYHRREQRATQALAQSEQRLTLALEGSDLSLWDWDLQRRRFTMDPRMHAMAGYTNGEVQVTNEWLLAHIHPDDRAAVSRQLQEVLKGQRERLEVEHRILHKDGHWVWLLVRGRVAQRDEFGRVLRMVGTDQDITERKRVQEATRVASAAFDASSAMVVSDTEGRIVRVNPAFLQLCGLRMDEVVGQKANLMRSGRHSAAFYAQMWRVLQERGNWEGELWNRRASGEVFLDWLAINAVKDAQGRTTHYVSVHTDITLRKRSEEEIRRLAFYDPLTELPNRRLLLERLGQMQANLARNQELGAVLFLDLDRFKALNDTLGHALGDALLQQVAKRLLCCVREMDTVARLGGDEFVVALAQLGTDLQAARVGASGVAHKILRALAEPFDLGGGATWQLSASVGLALLHDPQLPVESALQAADTAMYAAKADGRNAVRLA